MQYPLCRHIKTNGIQCKSPALTAGLYCFFHERLYARHSPFRKTPPSHAALILGHHIELEPSKIPNPSRLHSRSSSTPSPPANWNPAAPPRSFTVSH